MACCVMDLRSTAALISFYTVPLAIVIMILNKPHIQI